MDLTSAQFRQKAVDDAAWRHAPETRFIHGGDGQMLIHDGTPLQRKARGGVTQPWAHTVQPRPQIRHEQPALPFEGLRTDAIGREAGPASLIPTDRALHQLRVQNPRLNDYSFSTGPSPMGDEHEVRAYSKNGDNVGNLWWNSPSHGYEPNAVGMVETHLDHRGKGIAEGMWDYAHATAQDRGHTPPVHSANRSEQGEAFARRVGGVTPTRLMGQEHEWYD